jgi:OpgC protein
MRYLGIDLARSVAIIFVTLGHALIGANVQEGAGVSALRFFLSVSPPVFFCLFGCMLQLVYARQYAAGRQTEIIQRLLTRAVQCWALYVLTCAAMCIAAGLSISYFVRCALFLGDTPYTDILKFYAALLLAAPVLVAVSVRHGIWPLVAVCLAIQAAFPLISQIPPLQGFAGSGTVSAFLYGGEYIGHTGPSVIHGLGFVVFGMLLGRIWQSRPGREFLLSGPGWILRAAFLAMLVSTAAWIIAGGHNLLEPAERVMLRNTNHPLYLLFGCAAAIVFIEVFSAMRRLAGMGAKSFWLIFGQTSLFTFCFGNILLYAVKLPDPSAAPDPVRVVWSTLAALSLSILYYHFREGSWVKSDHAAARAYRWVADDSAAQLVRWVTNPFLTSGLNRAGSDRVERPSHP